MRVNNFKSLKGNKDLLKAKKVGILASRHILPGLTQFVMESMQRLARLETVFIGGWHAPIEKEIHKFLVKRQVSHIHVCAQTVDKTYCALNPTKTLFISHCHPGITRISRENALKGNSVLCELSDVMLIPWLDPYGKTHKIVLDFCNRMPVFVFDTEFNSGLIEAGALSYHCNKVISTLENDHANN